MSDRATRNTILVVDDDEDMLRVLRYMLNDFNDIETIFARNSAEASQLIGKHRQTIFLALLDLNLPDSPHGEHIEYILSLGIPSIVFTGNYDAGLRQHFLNLGVVDYVLKENRTIYDYLLRLIRRIDRNRELTALVVDDSLPIRSQLSKLLSLQMLNFHVATNGREALDILAHHPDIVLVICDYHMPEMDGFELVSAIRQNFSREKIAIIGISGESNGEVSARFLKLGANDFITKPFYQEEFFCRIMQNLDYIEQVHEIRDAAERDFLSGLYNRRYFFEQVADIEKRNKGKQTHLCVAMIDIDNFKKINDSYGHQVGDQVIVDLSQQLLKHLPDSLIARFGGEEFCVLFENCTLQSTQQLLDEMREKIAATVITINEGEIHYTISIGLCGAEDKAIDSLLSCADRALYQAKEQGRNRICRL